MSIATAPGKATPASVPGTGVASLLEGLAPTLPELLPERSPLDMLTGELPVTLGGHVYRLQVLSIAANRRWKEYLGSSLVFMLDSLEQAGDDISSILTAFSTATEQMTAALYAYDTARGTNGEATRPGVLPPLEVLEEQATDAEVLIATLQVWTAANPFAGVALRAMLSAEAPISAPLASVSSPPTSGAPQPTAGARRSSRRS